MASTVASVATSTSGVPTIAATRPAGAQAGDVLFAFLAHRNGSFTIASSSIPAGWSPAGQARASGSEMFLYTYTATAGDPASWTFGHNSAGNSFGSSGTCCVVAVRGDVNPRRPVDELGTYAADTGATVTVASLLAGRATLLLFCGGHRNSGALSVTTGPLTTLHAQLFAGGSAQNNHSILTASDEIDPGQATGARAMTMSGSVSGYAGTALMVTVNEARGAVDSRVVDRLRRGVSIAGRRL